VGSQGLVVTDSGNGLDWHPQFGGPVVGAAGLTNLIVVKALLDAAELAEAQGLDATAWRTQAAAVQAAMDGTLLDSSTGLYEVSDSRRGLVAQDVNALAVLWGRVADARAAQMLDALEAALAMSSGHRAFAGDSAWEGVISPMISGFEVAALFRAGRGTAALALIRAGWRMMIEHATHACGTTWESMTDQGVPAGADISLAHAWSSGPTASLSRHVLGLRPLQPGWTRWLCKPVLGDLRWAAGQVPTPQGALGVRWLRSPDSSLALALTLQVPEGTRGVVALPLSLGRGTVRVDGTTVATQDGLAEDVDLDRAEHRWLSLTTAGSHRIEVDAA